MDTIGHTIGLCLEARLLMQFLKRITCAGNGQFNRVLANNIKLDAKGPRILARGSGNAWPQATYTIR